MILRNGAQRSCDAELTCVNNGGTYDVLNSACTLGNVTYSDEDVCGWSQTGISQPSASSGSNWLSALSGFDFGIFSNAYCNLYPLLNEGNIPPECKAPSANGTPANGTPGPSEDTGKSGKYVLAIVLVVVVAIIAFFVIRKYTRK